MTQQFAAGKRAFGFCDRCGFRADLKRLAYQVVNQKPTGLKVCQVCNDKDQPQLQLGRFPINDPVALYQPRPDTSKGFGLFGWNPVGNPATYLTGSVGRVGVTTSIVDYTPTETYDFMLGSLPAGMTCSRASSAWYFNSSGVLTEASSNAARFNYNPSALDLQGLLVEPQRTNAFSNPRFLGAIPGNPGTPPTNTNTSFFSGLSREIVGTGTEDNIPYIDLRFFGTATSGSFSRFGLGNALTGLNISGNATSTFSVFVRLVNGSLSQISNVRIGINGRDSGGSTVSGQNTVATFTPNNSALRGQRQLVTWTPSNALVIYGEWFLDIVRGGTATVDITLRIGAPQHELGSFSTTPILPPIATIAVSTRAPEIYSMPFALPSGYSILSQIRMDNRSFGSGGTMIHETRFDDGGSSNTIGLGAENSALSTLNGRAVVGGAITQTANQSYTLGQIVEHAASYSNGSMSYCLSGAAPQTISPGILPALNRLAIVSGESVTYMRRIDYWNQYLTAAELQLITS